MGTFRHCDRSPGGRRRAADEGAHHSSSGVQAALSVVVHGTSVTVSDKVWRMAAGSLPLPLLFHWWNIEGHEQNLGCNDLLPFCNGLHFECNELYFECNELHFLSMNSTPGAMNCAPTTTNCAPTAMNCTSTAVNCTSSAMNCVPSAIHVRNGAHRGGAMFLPRPFRSIRYRSAPAGEALR